MSIGYFAIQKIRRVEEQCAAIGMRLASPKFGGEDRIALIPIDANSLPVYSRSSDLFTGTLDEVEVWLKGVEWARNYYRLLGVTTDKAVQRKEQDARNRNLISNLSKD
jgi:hypothetical protein